jgi:hypothetical protein
VYTAGDGRGDGAFRGGEGPGLTEGGLHTVPYSRELFDGTGRDAGDEVPLAEQ